MADYLFKILSGERRNTVRETKTDAYLNDFPSRERKVRKVQESGNPEYASENFRYTSRNMPAPKRVCSGDKKLLDGIVGISNKHPRNSLVSQN